MTAVIIQDVDLTTCDCSLMLSEVLGTVVVLLVTFFIGSYLQVRRMAVVHLIGTVFMLFAAYFTLAFMGMVWSLAVIKSWTPPTAYNPMLIQFFYLVVLGLEIGAAYWGVRRRRQAAQPAVAADR